MTAKCFVDTNVLVYASIDELPVLSQMSRDLLASLGPDRLVISTQVLLEYANVATRRFGAKGPVLEHTLRLKKLAAIRDTTADDVLDAVRLMSVTSISIWDAMIVTAAARAGCSILYTEDLNAGQVIGGIRVVNPFKPQEAA